MRPGGSALQSAHAPDRAIDQALRTMANALRSASTTLREGDGKGTATKSYHHVPRLQRAARAGEAAELDEPSAFALVLTTSFRR